MLGSASSNYHLGHSIKKRDPGRREGAAAEKAVPFSVPLFDVKPLVASCRRHGPGTQERTFEGVQQLRPKRSPDDQARFEMSEFSDSYVSRVLFATRTPACAVDAVARRWRWVRASVCDPYRPELHYMRGPGPKWREEHARGLQR
jgi:hypothetical protein